MYSVTKVSTLLCFQVPLRQIYLVFPIQGIISVSAKSKADLPLTSLDKVISSQKTYANTVL